METIKIAGVSCRVDRLGSSLSYEKIYNQAIQSQHWQGVKNASELIDKELRDNGFKPITTAREPIKANKSSKSRATNETGNTSKRKRNRKSSKE